MTARTRVRTRTAIATVVLTDTEYLVGLSCLNERRPLSMTTAEAAVDVVRWFHGLSESHPVSTRIDYTAPNSHNSTTFLVTFAIEVEEWVS